MKRILFFPIVSGIAMLALPTTLHATPLADEPMSASDVDHDISEMSSNQDDEAMSSENEPDLAPSQTDGCGTYERVADATLWFQGSNVGRILLCRRGTFVYTAIQTFSTATKKMSAHVGNSSNPGMGFSETEWVTWRNSSSFNVNLGHGIAYGCGFVRFWNGAEASACTPWG